MKTNTVLTIAALLALSTSFCTLPALADKPAGPAQTGAASLLKARISIAVDQFKIEEARNDVYRLPAEVREGLQSELIRKLLASGNFDVREREATAVEQGNQERVIDAEHRGSESGNGQRRPARQMRTAANYIITPTVIGFDPGKTSGGGFNIPKIGNFGGRSQTAQMSLNIRISDAQTGEIIASETEVGKQTSKSNFLDVHIAGINFNNEKFKDSAPGKAIDEALDKAVKLVCTKLGGQQKWTAKVVKQDEETGRVTINAGSSRGLAPGQELTVYHRGSAGTDPDTGLDIPGDEVRVGLIRIDRAEGGYSYATVLSGKNFRSGDIARAEDSSAN